MFHVSYIVWISIRRAACRRAGGLSTRLFFGVSGNDSSFHMLGRRICRYASEQNAGDGCALNFVFRQAGFPKDFAVMLPAESGRRPRPEILVGEAPGIAVNLVRAPASIGDLLYRTPVL